VAQPGGYRSEAGLITHAADAFVTKVRAGTGKPEPDHTLQVTQAQYMTSNQQLGSRRPAPSLRRP
jgi:hypothetical protein